MTRYGPYAETTPRGQTGWLDGARRPVPEHLRLMTLSCRRLVLLRP